MPSMTSAGAYAIIGVKKSATEAEIKSAYKKLALRTHPDKNPNDPDASKNFLRVSEAYKRIVDPSSFHEDDDDGETVNEEDFTSMCNMMFAEMFSGSDGGMFDFFGDDDDDDDDLDYDNDEMDMLRAMEMMTGGGEYNDEDDSDDECGTEERTIDQKLINLISQMSVRADCLGSDQFKMHGGAKSKMSRHSHSKSPRNPDYDNNDDADEAENEISESSMMMMMMQSMMTGSSPAFGAGRSRREKKGREPSSFKTDEKGRERVNGKSEGKHAGKGAARDDMSSMLQMIHAMEKAAGKSSIRSSAGKSKNNPKESRHRIDDDSEEEGEWETESEDGEGEGEEDWETAVEDDSEEDQVKTVQSIKKIKAKSCQKPAKSSEQSLPSKNTVAQLSTPLTVKHVDKGVKSSNLATSCSGSLSSESKSSSSVPAEEPIQKGVAVGDRVLVNCKYVCILILTNIYS